MIDWVVNEQFGYIANLEVIIACALSIMKFVEIPHTALDMHS